MALFVANWKMYKTYDEAVAFAVEHLDDLNQLSNAGSEIAIAPSFLCLDMLRQIFKDTRITLCAQNCASFTSGSYTGEVDGASLAQLGCSYAIVGHSERRQTFNETNEMIAAKANILFNNNIRPIICIGETQKEFEEGRALEALSMQLEPLIKVLDAEEKAYCIAYEPVWAIGTGKIPCKEYLKSTFKWIFERLNHPHCTLLYGGSVNETNARELLQIPHVGGLLIGKASCDFQSLKKIVSLAQIDY